MDRRRIATLGLAGALIALGLAACAMTPRNDRLWTPYLSHTSDVETSATRFTVTPVTDWTYTADGAEMQNYLRGQSYDMAELRNVWFVLEPQPGSTLAAHTFLMFEFTNDRLLGVTIEARREADEDYSAVRGAFNAFELAYVWGTARDLMTRRAVLLNHDLYMYPTQLSDEQRTRILQHLLERTQSLETSPRFYNTFTSNCTNELAKATKLRWHPAYILTGLSDEHLYRLGFIPGESFAQAHQRANVADFIRSHNGLPSNAAFDRALLTEMRRRSGAPSS